MSYNVATEFATITFGAPRDTFECFAQVGDPTSNVTAGLDRGDSLVGGKGTSLFPLSLKKEDLVMCWHYHCQQYEQYGRRSE